MNTDRFKFRVWDKKFKNYVVPSAVALLPSGVIAETDFAEGLLGTLPFSPDVSTELIIEQCTGVRDKNGKLIYEGDIIKYPWPYGENVVAWNPKTCRFVTHPIGRPELKASFCNDFDEFNAACPVIIGNIHENGGRDGETD